MRHRLLLISFTALLFLGYRAHAQNHPNLEKGFAADKMYQFGDVDHVNLFNGNVALTIPVGGSLPVSDHLSLSLTLIYNSKLWQAKETRKIINDELYVFAKYSPERTSNSGFGWTLSLGRLIDPSEVDVNKEATGFLYQAPDGSESAFYPALHQSSNDPPAPPTPDVAYSRDNTYLRLMHVGAPLDARVARWDDPGVRIVHGHLYALALDPDPRSLRQPYRHQLRYAAAMAYYRSSGTT